MKRSAISWKDDDRIGMSTGSLGKTFITVTAYKLPPFGFRASIKLPEELREGLKEQLESFREDGSDRSWYTFHISDEDANYLLDGAKERAIIKARELGARQNRRPNRKYDEAWLSKLEESILDEIDGVERYLSNLRANRLTTGTLQNLYDPNGAAHYLGRDHDSTHVKAAVATVLGRLERSGKIKSYTEDGKRRWMRKASV